MNSISSLDVKTFEKPSAMAIEESLSMTSSNNRYSESESDSDISEDGSPGLYLGTVGIFDIYKSTGYWLLYNTSIWKRQRTLNISRARHIFEYQQKIKTEVGNYEYIVPFYITEYKGNTYTFDGQHRVHAINQMSPKNQRELEIIIFKFKCTCENDIVRWFQNINLATPMPLPDLFQTDNRKIINEAMDILHKKYKKFISTAINRPRKPNIRLDDFKNELYSQDIVSSLEVSNGQELYQFISDYNTSLSNNDISFYPKYGNKPNEKAFKKANQFGFYLGMFNNYEWLSNLINIKNLHSNNSRIVEQNKTEKKHNIVSAEINNSPESFQSIDRFDSSLNNAKDKKCSVQNDQQLEVESKSDIKKIIITT